MELVTRSKDSYRCVCVCDRAQLLLCELETLKVWRARSYLFRSATEESRLLQDI